MRESYSPGVEDEDQHRGDDHTPSQAQEDGLVEDYRTILQELALLTTVSVLLFGFLLSSAGSFADSGLEEALYSFAIVLVATSTLIFVLPVAYHHIQFPYQDFDKFTERTHGWTLLGLPLLAGGLYLSLSLALWSLLEEWALAVAALPLVAISIVFQIRKALSNGG
jgi:hypothetical protein